MSKLSEMIKADAGLKGRSIDSETLQIEQALNRLFYAKPNFAEEIRMLKLQKQQAEEDRIGLHASSMLAGPKEFCYRQQVLSLFYKQRQDESIGINLKRIFEEGKFIGEKWQRLFIRGNLGRPEDMDRSFFNKKYDLSFTPDAKIVLNDKVYIVEIKSMNTFQFKKATSHPSGKKQLLFYLLLCKVKDGFVLVEDKNNQEFKIFRETFSRKAVEPYIERLKGIQYHKYAFSKKAILPKRKCDEPKCKQALKCNMLDACWNIGKGRREL